MHWMLTEAPSFVIDDLADRQADLALRSAGTGDYRFAVGPWRSGFGGMPVLAEAPASVEPTRWSPHSGGDHNVQIGRVDRRCAPGVAAVGVAVISANAVGCRPSVGGGGSSGWLP